METLPEGRSTLARVAQILFGVAEVPGDLFDRFVELNGILVVGFPLVVFALPYAHPDAIVKGEP
jgi:hypothetical protein